jgi:hypothetical protein
MAVPSEVGNWVVEISSHLHSRVGLGRAQTGDRGSARRSRAPQSGPGRGQAPGKHDTTYKVWAPPNEITMYKLDPNNLMKLCTCGEAAENDRL